MVYSRCGSKKLGSFLGSASIDLSFVACIFFPIQKRILFCWLKLKLKFAIAFAVALCFGLNPSKLIFEQSKMRDHLLHCLNENEFTNFPFSINPMWKKKKIVINKETLFCFCRGLYDSEMAKCISCHEWFHLRCLSSREVKHIKDDVTFQYSCSKCLKS